MANGVKTTSLTSATQVDGLIGNKDGTTVVVTPDNFALALIGAGPLSTQLATLSSQITSGKVGQPTWAELVAIVPADDGTGGEVLESDTGTHTDPVTSLVVANSGTYSWRAATPGWERIGDVGLAGKLTAAANLGDVSDPAAARTNLDVYGKGAVDASLLLKSDTGHGHSIADTGGLQTALDGITAKTDNIAISGPVDLDAIATRIADLDATVVLRGNWDASGGAFPGGGSAQAGAAYIVTTAGSVDGVDFALNDRVIAITDNASSGTYAGNWVHADYSDQVSEVNGQTGAVTLDKTDVGLDLADNTPDELKPVSAPARAEFRDVRGDLGALRRMGAVVAQISDKLGTSIARFVWDRRLKSNRLEGHLVEADFGGLRRAGATAMQFINRQGAVITDLVWDRQRREFYWRGHARKTDLGQLARGGNRLLTIQDQGRFDFSLNYDRKAKLPRWQDHALSKDLTPVSTAADTRAVLPATVRSTAGLIACQSEPSGYGWTPLPSIQTPFIIGEQNAGTDLEFRATWGLNILGRHDQGAFDPGAVNSLKDQGTFTDALPPAAGLIDGDYFEQSAAGGNTVSGVTYSLGDLAVVSGGAWVKQAAPVVTDSGDYVLITAAGTFKGIVLSVDDRFVNTATHTNSGIDRKLWIVGNPALGHVFLRGETSTPAATPPAAPLEGDLWLVSAPDGAYGAGDGMLFNGTAWARLPGKPITTFADGEAVWLDTAGNAANLEFRRVDKSTTRADFELSTRIETVPAGTQNRNVRLLGDSLPGISAPAIIAAMPERKVTVHSYGGGTSNEVAALTRHEILTGDTFTDQVTITWHGQNNIGGWKQASQINDELPSLVGGGRLLMMTPPGQWLAGFDGTRITVHDYEKQHINESARGIVHIRDHLKAAQPHRFFDTRLAMLREADGQRALLHPGMTEAEVAANYGIVPFSFFFDLAAVGWNAETLNYTGFHTAAGVPTGGADGDYKIRTIADGADPIGQLQVNEAGIWNTYQIPDITHMRAPAGNDALARQLKLELEKRNW